MADYSDIGNRLSELMRMKGMSGVDLSLLTGIHTNSISNYRHGYYRPNAINAEKMAKVFGVSVRYLLCETDDFNDKPVPLQPSHYMTRLKVNTIKLCKAFDMLDDEGQALAIRYVELLVESYRRDPQK